MPFILAGIMIAAAAASASAQNTDAIRGITSLNAQNAIQAREIADQKSLDIERAAEMGRRARALIEVSAGAAGISTSSHSIEAQFMDSLAKQGQAEALVIKANDEEQANRQARAESAYNSMLPPPGYVQGLSILSQGVKEYALEGGKF